MDGELSGYLDVKVPAQVRKRGFAPWKAWKRQWCIVRRCEGSGVEVQLGGSVVNCLHIPADSTLCRSESRSRQFAFGVFRHVGETRRPSLFLAGCSESDSQDWMAQIRSLLQPHKYFGDADFSVSLIDNAHSHAAGLDGFYGALNVGTRLVTLCSSSLEEVKMSFEWTQIQQCHLAVSGKTDDENRICVINTSSDFCAGVGQLYFFCKQAPRLVQCLVRRGPVPHEFPSPRPLCSGRRLSRSESDLRCYWTVEEVSPNNRDHNDFLHRPVLLRSHSGSRDSGVRVSTASDDSGHALRGKVASSLISAGLGLLFSTPGCSEADNESLHEYQHIGSYESDEDFEPVGALFRTNSTSTYSPRRESGISLASGIYEEISDDILLSVNGDEVQNHYENPSSLGWGAAAARSASPPPLPPRTQHQMGSLSEEALDEKFRPCCRTADSGIARPIPLGVRCEHLQTYSASCSALASSSMPGLPSTPTWTNWPARRRLLTEPEPDYVPMSPGGSSIVSAPLEESHYMVMASLNRS